MTMVMSCPVSQRTLVFANVIAMIHGPARLPTAPARPDGYERPLLISGRPMPTTVFRNCAWVVAWDDARASSVDRRSNAAAIRGSEIAVVVKGYEGATDAEVDCTARLVLPGLVTSHTHPTSEPLRKGITDETRSPGFWHSSLYEFLTVFNNDRE